MEFCVDFLYEADHSAPENVPFHSHQCYEMVLYKRGEGTVQIEDHVYQYGMDSIIIVAPGLKHNEINCQKSHNYVLGFHPEANVQIIPQSGLYHANTSLSILFTNMLSEITVQRPYFKQILSYQVGQAIIGLLRQRSIEKVKIDLSFILKYIDENYMLPIDLNYFSVMYHYSYDRFRHIFKEKTGMAPKEYILHKRLLRSKQLLKSETERITEIAFECGFYDSSQFSRIFKKTFGVTPLQYRKNHDKS